MARPLWHATHFSVAHYVITPFWSGPFWREFHENNFILFALLNVLFFSTFLFQFLPFRIFQFNKL